MDAVKKWAPILITWDDSNGSAEWIEEQNVKHGPNRIVEVGLFIKRDRTGVTTCKAHDTTSNSVHGIAFIPKGNIVSVVELKP